MFTKPMVNIATKVAEEDKKTIVEICAARGEDLSDFVRRAIKKELASLGFSTPQVMKALGLKVDEPSG